MDDTGIAMQILSLTAPGVQVFDAADRRPRWRDPSTISWRKRFASIPTDSPVWQPSRRRIPRVPRRNWSAACESWA